MASLLQRSCSRVSRLFAEVVSTPYNGAQLVSGCTQGMRKRNAVNMSAHASWVFAVALQSCGIINTENLSVYLQASWLLCPSAPLSVTHAYAMSACVPKLLSILSAYAMSAYVPKLLSILSAGEHRIPLHSDHIHFVSLAFHVTYFQQGQRAS